MIDYNYYDDGDYFTEPELDDRREDDFDLAYCLLCDAQAWVGDNDPLPTHCPICGCEFQQDRP